MHSMGLNAYRMGVDWSRFQPEPDGELDAAALEHLRAMLGSLRAKGIRPLLTLHHFAVPQWWLERGGFVREENLGAFLGFARFIVEGVADLVSDYITFNEPNVYSFMAYVQGDWPPAHRGLRGYLENMRVQRSMVLAHFTLYDFIHETHARRNLAEPQVSIAKHIRVMDPRNPNSVLDRDRARVADQRFNRLVPDCLHTGKLLAPLGRGEQIHDPAAWDFFGLNYYTRDFIRFAITKPHQLFIDVGSGDQPAADGAGDSVRKARNDLGWEIYPEGLERVLIDLHERYGMAIRITENGTADAADAFRQRYLHDHLQAVRKARAAGVSVTGYYHWSFMDNFEWSEGYVPRFGLVAVDYSTLKRRPRPSAKYYAQVALTGQLEPRSS